MRRGGSVFSLLDVPITSAPGADVLSDNGGVLHVALVCGMGIRCERCVKDAKP